VNIVSQAQVIHFSWPLMLDDLILFLIMSHAANVAFE